jgi:HNH endonuclease
MARTPEQRFAAKTNTSGPLSLVHGVPGNCHIWLGQLNEGGYGIFHRDGRRLLAHRASHEFHIGPIPDGLVVDHRCGRTSCVNPAHLEAVTQHVNTLRGHAGDQNSYKTHCVNGHEFTPENTRMRANGHGRDCRACHREYQRAHRAKAVHGAPNGAKTHCSQGHPYDDVNTYRTPSGSRMCRACLLARQRARRIAERATSYRKAA